MKNLNGRNAILTGASGGLGVFIGEALAAEGVNLFLVAYPGDGLPALAQRLSRKAPQRAAAIALDLRVAADRRLVVERAKEELGPIDILINNAGVEFNGRYDRLGEDKIAEVIDVNLAAPMMLTHALLPEMLQRRTGHIVNMSSLAGKSGPAFQEPYAATKAALTAFTYSLRATYEGSGVSASVVCPGFVETGIYTRLKERAGREAPELLGACPPERVAKAVVRAIRKDRSEIIINRYPVWPLLALAAAWPSLAEWIIRKTGVHEFFRRAAEEEVQHTGPDAQQPPNSVVSPSPRLEMKTGATSRRRGTEWV